MNYTLEHLKFAHNAGAQKLSWYQTVDFIALLDRNNLFRPKVPVVKREVPRQRITSKRKTRERRGGLSEKIMRFLAIKGTAGAHVTEIAKVTQAPLSSVRVWFYISGKKYLKSGEIKKVAPATFGYFKPGKAD